MFMMTTGLLAFSRDLTCCPLVIILHISKPRDPCSHYIVPVPSASWYQNIPVSQSPTVRVHTPQLTFCTEVSFTFGE